jgi:hypothetical protein
MEILRKKVERERNLSPSALYHLDPLKGDSPANFKAYLDGTLDTRETDSMMYGTATHAYMLERDRVVSVGNIKYPSGAIEEVIEALLLARDMDLDPESLASPEASEFITTYVAEKGIKFGNYKPENLVKHIIEVYDDFYKFQRKYRGTNAVLVNDQELSIVSDAAAFLKSNKTYQELSEQAEEDDVVMHEVYLKTPLACVNYLNKSAAVKLDLVKYSPSKKTIYVTDLKLTSQSIREFVLKFQENRRDIQFGFYNLPEIRQALKELLGIDTSEVVEFVFSVAMYSRTQRQGIILNFSGADLADFSMKALDLIKLAEMHAKDNQWLTPASAATDLHRFHSAQLFYLAYMQ